MPERRSGRSTAAFNGEPPRTRVGPAVKSDPWRKGARRPRPRFQLWSDAFWRRLTDAGGGLDAPFSGAVLEMICAENLRLYGKR